MNSRPQSRHRPWFERHPWLWAIIFFVGLAFFGYQYESSPSRVRAAIERQLADIDLQRREIAADRIRRAAEDVAFRVEVPNLDRETLDTLAEAKRISAEMDAEIERALNERERRLRVRLQEVGGR